ncbi:hypothetical protein [Methylocystis echinoides]|uniref:Uncharacterized protein n=1 Tax=Methylocystis echinoides TaxID=29468 RepID=A0A9W6GXV5_9HYPH|nr:hypothetical protein [Methylocystis echinoides]RTL86022.1 MAG: hypothetical protein EKK29_10945 [Hyphomicrobiales bacterium]GLI95157.1 hypothetical protein LMG27198_41490 [Methylocystis echinoides]
MSINRIARTAMFIAALAPFGAAPALAEDCGPGMMGCGKQGMKGAGMRDKGKHEQQMQMDKKMQELHQHQKMMEGIKDTDQMLAEMKKQMEMMTDVMDELAKQQSGGMGGSQPMSEH